MGRQGRGTAGGYPRAPHEHVACTLKCRMCGTSQVPQRRGDICARHDQGLERVPVGPERERELRDHQPGLVQPDRGGRRRCVRPAAGRRMGKVRSDADFYFYNNPVAADGSVQLLGKEPTGDGSEDRISFDLTAVPADVERIVVAASRYEGARFGAWAAAGAAPSPASSAVSTTPCSGSTPPWWSTWTLRHPGVRRRRSGPRCESRAAVVIAGCAARRAHRRPRIAPNCPRSRCARSTSSSSNRRSGLSISSPHSSRIWRRR